MMIWAFPIFQDSIIKLPLKSCFFRIGASLQPIPYLTPSKGPSVMSHLRMFRIPMSFWHVDYHFPRLLSATEYNSSDPSTPVKVSFGRMGERGKEKKKGKKNKKTLIRKYKYPLCGSCARTALCVRDEVGYRVVPTYKNCGNPWDNTSRHVS